MKLLAIPAPTALTAAALSLLAVAAFAQETPAPAADPVAANKALVRRYIEEVLSGNHQEKLEEMVAPDFEDHTPGLATSAVGPAVIRAAQERIRSVFPTVEYRIDDLIAEGDQVVARYTVTAATRAAEGQSPVKIEITGMTVFRIAAGKIRETWVINDQIEMYRQLGFTIQPPGTP